MKRLLNLFILPFLLVVVACNSAHLTQLGLVDDNSKTEKAVLAPDSAIDWPLMRDAVLNVCKDCHKKFGDYPGVTLRLEKILKNVVVQDMPPIEEGYLPLSPCQTAALKKWVELGAPMSSIVKVASLPECASL